MTDYYQKFKDWFNVRAQYDNTLNDQVLMAGELAWKHHTGQSRKFSGLPYFVHPFEVACRVYNNAGLIHINYRSDVVAAALLHDTLEDTQIEEKEIRKCGARVLKLVQELTNPSKGSILPRSERKKMDREHLKEVSVEAKFIKIIDRAVNLRDMAGAEMGFRRKYATESYALWSECLRDTNKALELELLEQIILCGGMNDSRI